MEFPWFEHIFDLEEGKYRIHRVPGKRTEPMSTETNSRAVVEQILGYLLQARQSVDEDALPEGSFNELFYHLESIRTAASSLLKDSSTPSESGERCPECSPPKTPGAVLRCIEKDGRHYCKVCGRQMHSSPSPVASASQACDALQRFNLLQVTALYSTYCSTPTQKQKLIDLLVELDRGTPKS
jgi:hypothetical protein